MMARLQARESILEATRAAVGSGTMKRGVVSDITRRWHWQARSPRRGRAQKATPELLQAMGIELTLVPAKASEA